MLHTSSQAWRKGKWAIGDSDRLSFGKDPSYFLPLGSVSGRKLAVEGFRRSQKKITWTENRGEGESTTS